MVDFDIRVVRCLRERRHEFKESSWSILMSPGSLLLFRSSAAMGPR